MFAVVDRAEAIQHNRRFLAFERAKQAAKYYRGGSTGAASSPLHSAISLLDAGAIWFILELRKSASAEVSVCLRNVVQRAQRTGSGGKQGGSDG
jgi:hypothetical protein